MTTKDGTGEPIIPIPSHSLHYDFERLPTVETPPIEDPNIPGDELWPEKRGFSLHNAVQAARGKVKANYGLLLIAASQAFFSLMNVAVKKLNSIDPPVSAVQLVLVRMAITWICCVTYMTFAKVPDPILGPKGVRLLLVFRGFSGFFGLFGVYYSLQYLSLSDATVLTFLVPMTTAVTGALLLGEKFSWKQAAAAIVSLVGVILIARPASLFGDHTSGAPAQTPLPDDGGLPFSGQGDEVTSTQRMIAIGVAMLGVLGATGAYTSIRAIGKRAHPLHALTSFAIQSVIVASVAMVVTHKPIVIPTKLEWIAMFFMIGIFGFFAQILLTLGLQNETASRGSMAIYTQIVFATIFERIFFNAVPTLLSAIGTLLIVSSAIYVALSKQTSQAGTEPDATVRLRRVSEDSLIERGLLDDHEYDGHPKSPTRGEDVKGREGHNVVEDRDIVLPLHTDDIRGPPTRK